jgi:type I restriction enzyme S subunit
MKTEWESRKVSDLCDLIVDCVNKTAPVSELPTPYKMIRTSHIKNGFIKLTDEKCVDQETFEKWTRRAKLQRGDVLLTREAPLGSVAMIRDEENHFLGQRIMQYRTNEQSMVSEFLLYSFLSPMLQYQFASYGGTGSTVDHIRVPDCSNFEVPVPPLADQKAIAHILGTLDDKIELNQKMNQTLEEIAKAIFKSWFVDFDPVRAKAEGRPTGLPPEISDLFCDELVDSEIGEIPKGWSQVEVVDLCDYVSSGGTPARKTQEYWNDGDIDWFKTGELLDRPLLDASEKITNLGVEKSAAKLWQRHTILFAIYASPTVGRLGYLTSPGTCNQAAAGLVAKQEIGMPFLFWTLFNARKELQNIAVGAAQQNINVGILKAHKCLEPTHDLTRIFSEFGLILERRRELIEKENRVLSELRDTLLPKLISGELRIPDAEKFLEEAGI